MLLLLLLPLLKCVLCVMRQVGIGAFAGEYRSLVPDSWAMVNRQDPVPRVPNTGACAVHAAPACMHACLLALRACEHVGLCLRLMRLSSCP